MKPRAPSLVSVGECMVELSPADAPGLFRMGYAGDSFNTAWYARRLLPADWRVGYASCVGRDAASDAMLAFMEAAGIDTEAVSRVEDRTVGLYLIALEDGERSFSYWRGQSAARRLADDPARLDRALQGAGVAFFSGITLAILPPEGRERLCAALRRAREGGTLVAFDTNMRPRLWSGADEMRAGLVAGAAVADLVLPSFDEEEAAFGDASPEETIARYREGGASLVAVKNGARPLHAWSAAEGGLRLDPVPVAEVVDSTAAGDSFDAGLLAALVQGVSLEEAARRAMALAAQVVRAPGALVSVGSEGPSAGFPGIPARPGR